MSPIIISSDEVKKKLKGYNPEKAELFHRKSAKIADKDFETALKNPYLQDVIFMSGGSASGKTEFVSYYLDDFDGIIVDSTLSTITGAQIKIKKIIKAKKTPKIYAIFPDTLARAFKAFLKRDRKFGEVHFYRTHSGSRKTLLWIAENHPEMEIVIFESSYLKNGDMKFDKLKLQDHRKIIEFLSRSQYTEEEIAYINRNIKDHDSRKNTPAKA